MKILKNKVSRAIETVLKSLEYPIMEYSLAPSKNPEFGDISSNVALILSRELKKPPIKIAKKITSQINEKKIKYVSSITVTNPGFINFFINASFFQKNIQKIWEHKEKYGSGDKGKGKTANVEFVSANPTGPLTVGHGRNAILGDTIANILKWNGYEVTREYYYNNAGRQMQILAKSVEARYYQICGKEHIFPDDGYQGEYIKNIAQNIINQEGSNLKPGSNIFIERVLPSTIMRELTDAEMDEYRRPFSNSGEDRRPTLSWPRQIPIQGEPKEVVEVVQNYSEWLYSSDLPKLFINADPGSILIGNQREFCRSWPNQTEVTVKGLHFLQEDSPDEIGKAISSFVSQLRGN